MNPRKIINLYLTHASIMLIFRWYYWDIVNIITPLLIIFPLSAAVIFSVCFLAYALVYAAQYCETLKHMAYAPLVIISITIAMALFFPFTKMTLELDFWTNFKARNTVVALIENGALQPEAENPHLIKLPWYCKHLSKGGGEVTIINHEGKDYYVFYTFMGIIDNYSGFIYVPEGLPPSAMYTYYYQVEKMSNEWYFCAAT